MMQARQPADRNPGSPGPASDPPPPSWLRTRNLWWPALGFIALMALPPGVALAWMLCGVVGRAGWRAFQHVQARDAEIARRAALGPTIAIGRDSTGRVVEVPERTLAAHGLILGATGAGKSTTLLTLLDDQIRRGRPVVAIDLKGSPSFAAQLQASAAAASRRFVEWTPDGQTHWNPLAAGNATELKDKLLGTERFTEPHYRRAAERYLQLAIQVALESLTGTAAHALTRGRTDDTGAPGGGQPSNLGGPG